MQQSETFNPVDAAKSLIRMSKQGALATLSAAGGDPYCSLVNVATAPEGSPVMLVSTLALHTRNFLADPRVSLMLDERRAGDPLVGTRVMIAGRIETINADAELGAIRSRYLLRHPSAETFVDFKDFSFFRIAIRDVHLVAGFGRIIDIAGDRVLTDVAGANELLAGEAEAIAHMNADHAEANALYATRLLGGVDGAWRITGLDPEGADLACGDATLRLPFPERVLTLLQLRKTLVALASRARAGA